MASEIVSENSIWRAQKSANLLLRAVIVGLYLLNLGFALTNPRACNLPIPSKLVVFGGTSFNFLDLADLARPIWLASFWSAVIGGIGILILQRPSTWLRRHIVTLIVGLMCTLSPDVASPGLVIENHFVFFVALVFLAQTLDVSVLWNFAIIVGAGHEIMGYYAPMCIYGVPHATWQRAAVHAGYVGLQVMGLMWFIHIRKKEIKVLVDVKKETLDERVLRGQLEESNASLKQFSYIASHDLRQPLRAINGFSDLLARRYKNILPENAREYLKFIQDGVAHMTRLLEGLLDYSRALSQGVKLERVDMNELLKEIMHELPEQQRTVVYVSENLPTLYTDRSRVQRTMLNALDNALKYVAHGTAPLVTVSVLDEKENWHFEVRDTGIGMSAEEIAKVGFPFVRIFTQAEYPGTGIGLASCKIAASRLGGQVWLTSPGKGLGTTFHLTLPKTVRSQEVAVTAL